MIIGRLVDIDIVFLHYHSFEDALAKWNRRKKRLNMNNLIVKFNDQNGCQKEDVYNFNNLPYKNKIFLTSNLEWSKFENAVFYPKYQKYGYIYNDTKLSESPLNIKRYLNSIAKN